MSMAGRYIVMSVHGTMILGHADPEIVAHYKPWCEWHSFAHPTKWKLHWRKKSSTPVPSIEMVAHG